MRFRWRQEGCWFHRPCSRYVRGQVDNYQAWMVAYSLAHLYGSNARIFGLAHFEISKAFDFLEAIFAVSMGEVKYREEKRSPSAQL